MRIYVSAEFASYISISPLPVQFHVQILVSEVVFLKLQQGPPTSNFLSDRTNHIVVDNDCQLQYTGPDNISN